MFSASRTVLCGGHGRVIKAVFPSAGLRETLVEAGLYAPRDGYFECLCKRSQADRRHDLTKVASANMNYSSRNNAEMAST